MMKKTGFVLCLAVMAPALVQAALAPEPATVRADPYDVAFLLNLGVAQDDNVYTEPGGAEDSSAVFTLNPVIVARLGDDDEFNEFLLSATGGLYSESSDDNYTDYRVGYTGRHLLYANMALASRFGVYQGHEERGSSRTESCIYTSGVPLAPGCDSEPDVYHNSYGGLAMTLGTRDSRGRVTVGASRDGRRYTNNGPVTGFREYDLTGGQLKFAWRVGGKTDVVLETNYSRYNYLIDGVSSPDSDGLEYLVGAEWDVTGKTTGYAKFGRQEKDFRDSTRTDLDDSTWRIGMIWSPQPQTTLNLELAKRYEESDGVGTAKEIAIWSARASHLVRERIEPWVRMAAQTTDYQGAARSDETSTLGLGVDYKFRRYAVFGVSWMNIEQDSNVGAGAFDFERGIFAFTANLSM